MQLDNFEVIIIDIEITPPKKPMAIMMIWDSAEQPMTGMLAAGKMPGTDQFILGFKLENGLQVGCTLTRTEVVAISAALSSKEA